jgi:hypothetical protein
MISIARLFICLTAAVAGTAYALDAPLWHGAAIVAIALLPIGATLLWDYLLLGAHLGEGEVEPGDTTHPVVSWYSGLMDHAQAFLDIETGYARERRWRRLRRFLRWILPLSVGIAAFVTTPFWLHWLAFGTF